MKYHIICAFTALALAPAHWVSAEEPPAVIAEDSGGPLDWPLEGEALKQWRAQNGLATPTECGTDPAGNAKSG